MTYSQPLLLIFFLVAVAGLIFNKKRLVIAGVGGIVLITIPAAEWLFSRPLDGLYPVRPFTPPAAVEAIVVFSGGVNPAVFERPYAEANKDTASRCEYAAWIYRQRPMPVLACGGLAGGVNPPYSAAMRELLRRGGVPDEMIWTEDQSRNTHENALYGARILRRHGIGRVVLVVDARSMVRASACMRKEGIQVTPAPCRLRQWGPLLEELIPNWKGLKGNEETLHEMLGWLWYRMRGWI